MSAKIFGIDFTSGGLKVAVIEKQFRSFKVAKLVYRQLISDSPEEPARVVKETLKSEGYDGETDRVIAVFPSDRLTSRVLSVPLTIRKMISETLPFEIEPLIPFDAEDIVSDFLTIGPADDGSRILAVVAKKEDIEAFLNIYALAGLDPDMVIPEPICAGREAKYRPTAEGEGGAEIYVNLKENAGSITVVKDQIPVSFHTASSGMKNGVEPLANEIKRQMLGGAGEATLNLVVLSGEQDGLDQVARKLESTLGAPVRISDMPGAGAALDSQRLAGQSETKAMFALALGAALIVAEGEENSSVNLRAGEYKRKPRIAGCRAQFFTAATLFIAGALAWTIAYFIDGAQLTGEYKALKAQIRSEFKQALPDVKKIVSEEQQLKNALAKLQARAKALGVGTGGVDPFLDFLSDITLCVPDDVKLDVEDMVYEPDSFIIAGHTGSFEKVDKLKKNIGNLPWTGKVTVERAKADVSGSGVKFRLEVRIVL